MGKVTFVSLQEFVLTYCQWLTWCTCQFLLFWFLTKFLHHIRHLFLRRVLLISKSNVMKILKLQRKYLVFRVKLQNLEFLNENKKKKKKNIYTLTEITIRAYHLLSLIWLIKNLFLTLNSLFNSIQRWKKKKKDTSAPSRSIIPSERKVLNK